MLAAAAAGVYPSVTEAQKRMGSGFDKVYKPDRAKALLYLELYRRYTELSRSLEPLLRKL
jgi:L-ribulokinase